MKEVRIKDLGEIITGNTPSKKEAGYWNSKDIPFIKPDIISDSGITVLCEADEYLAEHARSKARIVNKDTVLVTCIGSIGKVGIASEGEYAFNQQINAIVPKNGINPKYLAYAMLQAKPRLEVMANAPVVPIINKSQFGEFQIHIESDLTKQKNVVDQLDKLNGIIDFRKAELTKLDTLIKARFVEMFGDMLINPKGLPEQRLDSLADIVSGITKGRKVKINELYEVPYMAVSNVKNGYIDWTTVKTIMATSGEIDQYRLLPDDVLMTEGGDPDKLGRGAIIHEPPKDCIHQNHIFRVRLNQSMLLSVYMAQYLQQQKAKRYFLGCAKQTTGIASINMRQLSALPVLVPPIKEQEEYANFVAQIDKSKSVIQKSLDEAKLLFDSLMQKYFG